MPVGLDPWALVGVDSSGAGVSDPNWYQALVNYYGVAPDVARSMVNNREYAEGQTPGGGGGWPYPYAGKAQEEAAAKSGASDEYLPRERNLGEQMRSARQGRPTQQPISYQPGVTPVGMGADLKAAGETPQPDLTQQYRSMIANGIPPNVALNILIKPSYGEGDAPRGADWPYQHGGREYQPGASAMPGMPWDDPSAGGQQRMTPQQQLMMRLLMTRGAGGMQSPLMTQQLIQYYLGQQAQNQQGDSFGNYPRDGGGVSLASDVTMPSGQTFTPSNLQGTQPLPFSGANPFSVGSFPGAGNFVPGASQGNFTLNDLAAILGRSQQRGSTGMGY